MIRFRPVTPLALALLFASSVAHAQMPFYTDDTSVTEPGKVHVEAFDELDGLQSSQYPDLRQNTANLKLNFSPIHRLEIDLDLPYLSIDRAKGTHSSRGIGDTNLGAKWSLRKTPPDSTQASTQASTPASFALSLYIEFPTGDERQELGSGLTDYWLNFITQKPLTDNTRINANLGILLAGNTSTGVLGIETRHGFVYTGGLSLLHDLNPHWTLGAELYGGVSDGVGADKTQLQAMLGAQYTVHNGLTLSLGILGGKYGATPNIGAQLGIAIDLPDALQPPTKSTNYK